MMLRRLALPTVILIGFVFAGGAAATDLSENEIVQRATAALNSDWATDPTYASIEKEETVKGEKRTSKTFEVVMIEGSDYDFPMAENDVPLTPEQTKAELLKLKSEVQRRKNESPAARRERIAAWKKRRDEDGELLLDFPTALTFHLVGEETRNGRAAYILSGAPKPGLVPKTRAAKVLSGIEGKAWVDKETLHPMRVECSVVKSVPVFGPLASVLPGTDIDIAMTPVTDSVWLIDEVTMKLHVSKLHMFKSSEMTRSTWTRYRPNSAALEELLSKADEH